MQSLYSNYLPGSNYSFNLYQREETPPVGGAEAELSLDEPTEILSPAAVEARAVAPKQRLTWDDFIQLFDSDLVLRHVSSIDSAKSAAEKGFSGDAISISRPGLSALIEHLKSEGKLNKTNLSTFFLSSDDLKTLDLEDQQTILNAFEKQLGHFIYNGSVIFDVNTCNRPQTSFILIKTPHGVRDTEGYYHLGKMGTRYVKAQDVKGLVFPGDFAIQQSLSHDAKESTRVVNYYFNEILKIAKVV